MSEPDTPDHPASPAVPDHPEAQADHAPEHGHAPSHAMEHRNHPRHNVRWHADVLLDGHAACEGYAREVSADGLTLFLDINTEREHIKSVALRIHVPPLDDKHPQHIVEVEGRIVYISHDADEHMFRAGIHFTHFENDSDKAFLAARLEE